MLLGCSPATDASAQRWPRSSASCRRRRPGAPGAGPSIPPIRVDVTGTGRTVTTGARLTVPVTMHPRELPALEVVVVPALATMTAEDTLSAPAARATRAVIRAVGMSPARTTASA